MHLVRLFAVCLSLVLTGCAGAGGTSAGAAIPDGESPAARLYVSRCSACHAVPHPGRHDYGAWVYLVALMEQRMAERGMSGLTDADRTAILGYLQDHAR